MITITSGFVRDEFRGKWLRVVNASPLMWIIYGLKGMYVHMKVRMFSTLENNIQ